MSMTVGPTLIHWLVVAVGTLKRVIEDSIAGKSQK
jgi:hypothetical protein